MLTIHTGQYTVTFRCPPSPRRFSSKTSNLCPTPSVSVTLDPSSAAGPPPPPPPPSLSLCVHRGKVKRGGYLVIVEPNICRLRHVILSTQPFLSILYVLQEVNTRYGELLIESFASPPSRNRGGRVFINEEKAQDSYPEKSF